MKTATSYQEVQTRSDEKKILAFDFLGYTVFVGTNAASNDTLVSSHKTEHPKCLWLHIIGRKGAHCVLCLCDKQGPIDMMVLRFAAHKALKFSGVKTGRVAFAPLDDVYKPEHSAEGIFRTWRVDHVEL
jgi:hypothetical protein